MLDRLGWAMARSAIRWLGTVSQGRGAMEAVRVAEPVGYIQRVRPDQPTTREMGGVDEMRGGNWVRFVGRGTGGVAMTD